MQKYPVFYLSQKIKAETSNSDKNLAIKNKSSLLVQKNILQPLINVPKHYKETS